MKKFILLVAFAAICSSSFAQFYPKDCIQKADFNVNQVNGKQGRYGAPLFDVKVQRASISAITVPVSMGQATVVDGKIEVGSALTIGGAYIFGAANVQILKDSSVFVSGNTYYGVAAAWGAKSIFSNSEAMFVVGPIFGYESFAIMPGLDLLSLNKPTGNFVIAVTYNLAGLPFLNPFTKIKINEN